MSWVYDSILQGFGSSASSVLQQQSVVTATSHAHASSFTQIEDLNNQIRQLEPMVGRVGTGLNSLAKEISAISGAGLSASSVVQTLDEHQVVPLLAGSIKDVGQMAALARQIADTAGSGA